MIKSVDHIVITTRDLDKCLDFYTRVLGMQLERYGENRIALRFGDHKFNVHPPGFDAGIKARTPTPVAVGFGVRDAASAAAIARFADAVVIGSALVEKLAGASSAEAACAAAREILAPIRTALDAGAQAHAA